MENEKVIVAIEFGSSKIAGMAGVQAPDGGLKVLSYHEQPSSQFIHHGIVYNVTRTAEAIENIRTKIENDLDAAITQVGRKIVVDVELALELAKKAGGFSTMKK